MASELDSLATTLYVKTDDLLTSERRWIRCDEPREIAQERGLNRCAVTKYVPGEVSAVTPEEPAEWRQHRWAVDEGVPLVDGDAQAGGNGTRAGRRRVP
ncbi:hypothetical protein AB0E62_38450 [Streptomyces sp. NPDC038707]|uniref:hypothetical protein n=1 Tax=Streptomyces sp. NPDC038707 TaxID=3154329 RepID=UPI0033D63BF8